MTQTKINKSIAILLAMCIAFALLSVTMLNNAKAETINGSGVTYEITAPDYKEDAPDITVDIKFPNADAAVTEDKIAENVKVYLDEEMKNEVVLNDLTLDKVNYSQSEISFVVPLSKVSGLDAGTTYYLALLKPLTETAKFYGADIVSPFEVKKAGSSTTESTTKSTTKSTTSTTRKTTYRTITTRKTTYRTVTTRTVTTAKRANAANTGDESNMPLWIGLAILAAGAGAFVYVWKEQE